ncbi:MAG TPA: preprotein translocase subunit YajC [Puia sp.]|nr:preprotein translocase subunit YajC [Puia sp.]
MTNSFSIVLLQAANPNMGVYNILLIGGMILVFWLFMIRPQAKKQKLAKKFQEEMQKGDKIVTIAGIHGKVYRVNDDGTIDLEVSPGSYLKIEKSAISIEWSQNANKAITAPADKK